MSYTEIEERLALLRIQLYTAMQTLKDEPLQRFWILVNEIADNPDNPKGL